MLTPISREAIPTHQFREPFSPITLFITGTVKEFTESGEEAMEVSKWPRELKPETVAKKLRDQLWRVKFEGERLKERVEVMRRGERVFIRWRTYWDGDRQEDVSMRTAS
jgi:hypothetical protein